MSSDPESYSLLAKVLGAAAAVVTPIWGARTWLESRLSKKADKADVAETFGEVREELKVHRGYFKNVFEQMRDMENKAHDRHVELLKEICKK